MSIMQNEHADTDEVRKLANPFSTGDTVVIPVNTPYTTTAPNKRGIQYSKRQQTVKLFGVGYAYILDQDENGIYTRDATVEIAGTGGYWKDFILTPEILHANGKEVETVLLHDPKN